MTNDNGKLMLAEISAVKRVDGTGAEHPDGSYILFAVTPKGLDTENFMYSINGSEALQDELASILPRPASRDDGLFQRRLKQLSDYAQWEKDNNPHEKRLHVLDWAVSTITALSQAGSGDELLPKVEAALKAIRNVSAESVWQVEQLSEAEDKIQELEQSISEPAKPKAEDGILSVDDIANIMLDAWEKAEGERINVSYVATVVDMARAVLAALSSSQSGVDYEKV